MSAGAFSQEPLSAGLRLELHEKLRLAYRRRLRAEVPRAADPHMPKQCSSVPPKLGDINFFVVVVVFISGSNRKQHTWSRDRISPLP